VGDIAVDGRNALPALGRQIVRERRRLGEQQYAEGIAAWALDERRAPSRLQPPSICAGIGAGDRTGARFLELSGMARRLRDDKSSR
jgi:hypothetical protein